MKTLLLATAAVLGCVGGAQTGYAAEVTLYTFTGSAPDYGVTPTAGLIADAAGNLFGTTANGGTGYGNVFELKNSGGGSYTPISLYSFTSSGTNGSLLADANGNLFGTSGGGFGTVFELKNNGGSYTPTTLYTFTGGTDGGGPNGSLLADAAGNLFGTTSLFGGTTNGNGTVFELKNNGGGSYTQSTLYRFTGTGTDGTSPYGGPLLADASGDLFGTTGSGGSASNKGTVFELKNNGDGTYAHTTLYSFTGSGTDGADPWGGVVADAAGNLFGTTASGGSNGGGTVFELRNNGGDSYTHTTLYSFAGFGTDGVQPAPGPLLADAAGNLFGTTVYGGSSAYGTVFELKANGGGSYTPTTLYSFAGSPDGANPEAGLLANAAGNLFGTTASGGPASVGGGTLGTVFEITGSGFATPTSPVPEPDSLALLATSLAGLLLGRWRKRA